MPKPRTKTGAKNVSGEQIRLLRAQNHWSQRDLAHQMQLIGMDMDKNVITRIETGKRAVMDFELQAFQRLFGVPYEYLIDGGV